MKKDESWGYLIITLVIAAILVGGFFFWQKDKFFGESTTQIIKPLSEGGQTQTSAAGSGWSAVFLTNNQVYFGKVSNLDSNYATLKEVYYLRVQKTLQPSASGGDVKVEGNTAAQAQKNELSLIKLGNELHGPMDEIKLNRQHILYVEELKEDSKVVKAISDYKAKNP